MNTPDTSEASATLNIGLSIKKMRKARGLSLREMASRAGITASFISQVENGRASPSVETLFSLAGALGVPVSDFFTGTDQLANATVAARSDRRIIRRGDRKSLKLDTGIVWQLLTGEEQKGIRFVEIFYPPGGCSAEQPLRHTGRDFFVVMEGEIIAILEFQEHVLHAGDSMWFDATIPHQIRNDSDAPARLIALTVDPWVMTGTAPTE